MPYASYKYWPGRKLSFAGVCFSEAGQIRALTVALGVGWQRAAPASGFYRFGSPVHARHYFAAAFPRIRPYQRAH
jgi:hypothetical protein